MNNSRNNIPIIGSFHLLLNLVSGGLAGTFGVLLYLLFKGNTISSVERSTCYNIINFNLSYIIYVTLAAILCFVLIGFILLPIIVVMWFILLILGVVTHLSGEDYKYFGSINFLTIK